MELLTISNCDQVPLVDLLNFLQAHHTEAENCGKIRMLKESINIQADNTNKSEILGILERLIASDSYVAIKELINRQYNFSNDARFSKLIFSKQPREDELMWLLYLFPTENGWPWKQVYENPNFYPEKIAQFKVEQTTWLNLYYPELGGNPNLTIEFLRYHLSEKWNWKDVSANSAFRPDDILNNPDFKWDPMGLARNDNLNIKLVEWCIKKDGSLYPGNIMGSYISKEGNRTEHRVYVFWSHVISNKNITPKDLEKFKNKNGSKPALITGLLYLNPNLTAEEVLQYPDSITSKWNWVHFSRTIKITPSDVQKLPQLNFHTLSANENLPISYIVLTYREKNWDLRQICSRRDLTVSIIEEFLFGVIGYCGEPAWYLLSVNPAVPWWFIRKTIGKSGWTWKVEGLFTRHDVDYEWLSDYTAARGGFGKFSWNDWVRIFSNPAIPLQFVHTHKLVSPITGSTTDYTYVNPNVTVGYVVMKMISNTEKDTVNFEMMSRGLFTKNEFHQNIKKNVAVEYLIKESPLPEELGEIIESFVS